MAWHPLDQMERDNRNMETRIEELEAELVRKNDLLSAIGEALEESGWDGLTQESMVSFIRGYKKAFDNYRWNVGFELDHEPEASHWTCHNVCEAIRKLRMIADENFGKDHLHPYKALREYKKINDELAEENEQYRQVTQQNRRLPDAKLKQDPAFLAFMLGKLETELKTTREIAEIADKARNAMEPTSLTAIIKDVNLRNKTGLLQDLYEACHPITVLIESLGMLRSKAVSS